MPNTIYFADNLPILQSLPSASVDLIYIDPPFNTGKTQQRTQIKTVRINPQDDSASTAASSAPGIAASNAPSNPASNALSNPGGVTASNAASSTPGIADRTGFQGARYATQKIGSKSYADLFDDYLAFLEPRLLQAYRVLKPHGSLFFHIDYREVHYCKILLDGIFGRASFLNEIIWAYDYGARTKKKWPPKHDNILWYAKDPKHYTFNVAEIERIPYMAPGLVGPEKAARGKLPTDTWWMTIVPTNSKEKTGYPTQKPLGLVKRILSASSNPGEVVLDFFAGSGTVGEACLQLGRQFILVDSNPSALEVMARRFKDAADIEWVNFTPAG